MKTVLITFIIATLIVLVLPANSDFLATTDSYAPLVSVFLSYISHMFLPSSIRLFSVSISDPITLYVLAAVVFSITATMPIFAYQTYKFVSPALFPHEKRMVYPFVVAVSSLFIGGIVFGFFFLFPAFLQGLFPFFSAVGAEPWFSIMDFYSMLFFTVIVSGFLFTIPAFFVLLVKFGVVRTDMFTKKRKFLYLGLIVAAMVISPGATPQGNLYLFIILVTMLEVSILLGKRYEPKPYIASKLVATDTKQNLTCTYCGNKTNLSAKYCQKCKRYLI